MSEVDQAARSHPMVLAAQARLAHQGGWARILAGEPLDADDLPDADLLVAAGVLTRDGGDYALARPEFHHHDPVAIAADNIAYLRRALRYAQLGAVGWAGDDPVVVRAQSRASSIAADMIAEVLEGLDGPCQAFRDGHGRFLDVGVGAAGISVRMCELFPGTRAVGLDVLPDVLETARKEVAERGLEDDVELRLLDVAELDDDECFHLAWLPQPFLPPATLEEGLVTVRQALCPDGWLVLPLQAPTGGCDFDRALTDHSSHLMGGGAMTREEAEQLVGSAGYEDLAWHEYHGLSLLFARRPAMATVTPLSTPLSRKVSGADRSHGGRRLGEEHGVGGAAGAGRSGDRRRPRRA